MAHYHLGRCGEAPSRRHAGSPRENGLLLRGWRFAWDQARL